MNIKELLNNNPLSKELIRQWFLEKRIRDTNDAKDIPKAFKKAFIDIGITDKLMVMYIETNPHCLFEIFDENKIFISIEYFVENAIFNCFVIEVIPNDSKTIHKNKNTRLEAEKWAVEGAITMLENKLKERNTNA